MEVMTTSIPIKCISKLKLYSHTNTHRLSGVSTNVNLEEPVSDPAIVDGWILRRGLRRGFLSSGGPEV